MCHHRAVLGRCTVASWSFLLFLSSWGSVRRRDKKAKRCDGGGSILSKRRRCRCVEMSFCTAVAVWVCDRIQRKLHNTSRPVSFLLGPTVLPSRSFASLLAMMVPISALVCFLFQMDLRRMKRRRHRIMLSILSGCFRNVTRLFGVSFQNHGFQITEIGVQYRVQWMLGCHLSNL